MARSGIAALSDHLKRHEVGTWIGPALHDILDEFYKTTQAMIGEAISVSELKAFLAAKAKELK